MQSLSHLVCEPRRLHRALQVEPDRLGRASGGAGWETIVYVLNIKMGCFVALPRMSFICLTSFHDGSFSFSSAPQRPEVVLI